MVTRTVRASRETQGKKRNKQRRQAEEKEESFFPKFTKGKVSEQ